MDSRWMSERRPRWTDEIGERDGGRWYSLKEGSEGRRGFLAKGTWDAILFDFLSSVLLCSAIAISLEFPADSNINKYRIVCFDQLVSH
jgi:hypothetical protein